jgi:asparagine synthase (glutamine-hydrolysing)
VLTCFDEPFAGVISSFFLSQRIAQHVKVAVSGDGADEVFGSYRSHREAATLADGRAVNADWRARLLVYSEPEKCDLYQPDVARQLQGVSTTALLAQTFSAVRTNDPLNRVLEAEFKTIFPDQVLTYVDRLSMAHSLEVRTAYLDTDVVTFLARLPGNLKIRNGETKFLLKQAARRYFPAEMIERPKEGFLMPVTEWMLGDLQSYVRDTLAESRIKRQGFFKPERVRALVDRVYQPGADYTDVNRVLGLVVFQEWHDLYMA